MLRQSNKTKAYALERKLALMANIEEKVEVLVKQKIEELGYKLYDVEYTKEGKNYFLRIYIDSENGIGLEDCEKTTNAINDILDKADYIKNEYFLEVSSPGIERILRRDIHLQESIGMNVEVKLFKPIDKQKNLSGVLEKFDKENIYLKISSGEKIIARSGIAQIKTKYEW